MGEWIQVVNGKLVIRVTVAASMEPLFIIIG